MSSTGENAQFHLRVTDNNGEELTPLQCHSCGEYHMFVVKTREAPSFEFVNTFDCPVVGEITGGSMSERQILLQGGQRFKVPGRKLNPLPVPPPVWVGEVKIALTKHEGESSIPGLIEYKLSGEVHADFSQEFHQGRECTHDGHVHIVFMDERTWAAMEFDRFRQRFP